VQARPITLTRGSGLIRDPRALAASAVSDIAMLPSMSRPHVAGGMAARRSVRIRVSLPAERQAERRIAADEGNDRPFFPGNALRARTLAARRDRLLAMRSKGVIGDEAFHRLEEELVFSDVAVATRMQA
jgi:hypothetical protein